MSSRWLIEVVQELVTISKETGASPSDLIAAAQGNEIVRIGDALDRIADALTDSVEAKRRTATEEDRRLFRLVKAVVGDSISRAVSIDVAKTQEAIQALNKFFVEPLTPRPGDVMRAPDLAVPFIHDDGCTS